MNTRTRAQRLLVSVLACTALLRAAERPDLTGKVMDSDGAALQGATVFIYTAEPKEGPGILCPSCYVDCAKRTRTAADGSFVIEDLDPSLLFRVLVVAKGHQPEFVTKVDPAKQTVQVNLKKAADGVTPDRQMRGRVVDIKGNPVEGAVVNIRGVSRGPRTQFGGNDDIDLVAVSDADGNFVISGQTAFDAVGVDVEARGFARGVFRRLATGGTIHELKLVEGATVKGRAVKDGEPVAGVEIGLSGVDREASAYVGNWSVATDDQGYFMFVNIPPDTGYQIYGKMESLGSKGAIPSRAVRSAADGATLDVGNLEVEPGWRVAGQVVLTDGAALPENTRVLLGREDAWDSVQVELDRDGRFAFAGVPKESVSLSVRVKGYRLTTRNGSLDPFNPFHLIGRVYADKTNLVLELEPGSGHDRLDGDQAALQEEPLRGAEAADPIAGGIHVTGQVLDFETGEPVRRFFVTEGRKSDYQESMSWFRTRKQEFNDGQFSVSFVKRPQPPGVLIEAQGYAPEAVAPTTTSETNVIVRLRKGSDITALLRRPDGSPAANVDVYLTDMNNGVYLGEDLRVQDHVVQATKKTTTDDLGRFSFPPQIDACSVVVVDDTGFANVRIADLKEDLHLQPWAKVEGTLKIGSKPAPGESVRLWPAHVPFADFPRQFPAISLYLHTQTDQEGRFEFNHVPPIDIEVYHEPKIRDSRIGEIPMSQTVKMGLTPGETHNVVLGGQGRPVIGRMTVPNYDGEIDWRADVHNLELVLPEPAEISMIQFREEWHQKFLNAKTDDEKLALQEQMRAEQQKQNERMREFYQTEAGRAYHFAQKRYALVFQQDGSFRVEDVPGGSYMLQVDLHEPSDQMSRFSAPQIASLRREIQVPDSPGGRTDEPFDLGTIELHARLTLKPGKEAPPFEVKTIDDRTVKLADYKGKFLLLDFWAVWCGPCVAETPHLRETYDQFKNDSRFAMLGLSLDPDVDTPREYAARNNLGWTQGFLGEWSETDLPDRYGVEGIPSIFLIGPDGRIIATNLRGHAIQNAVAAALD